MRTVVRGGGDREYQALGRRGVKLVEGWSEEGGSAIALNPDPYLDKLLFAMRSELEPYNLRGFWPKTHCRAAFHG